MSLLANARRRGSLVIVVWLLLVCGGPPEIYAAYTVATLVAKDELLPDGRGRIVVKFTGNAGEPDRYRDLYITDQTAQDIRRWAITEATRMGTGKTVFDGLSIGQSINLAPIAPPTPTTEEIWRKNYSRYLRLKAGQDAGIVPVGDTAVATLKAGLIAGWLPAYAAGF